MKNAIRCCISCILPCGALDVIRIVHSNGRVEEISGTIRAEDIMKAHPKHILKKPTSRLTSEVESIDSHHRGPTIVVVPPDAQLQRGKIYFLIPVLDHNQSSKKKTNSSSKKSTSSSSSPSVVAPVGSGSASTVRRKRKEHKSRSNSISLAAANLVLSSTTEEDDKYLSDILSEKVISSHREKRRGRVAVWRPHLESITETLSEAASSDH